MATLYTDVSLQQTTPTNPAARLEGNLINGRVVHEICTYTTTGLEVTNDVILVGYIPQAARMQVDMWRVAGIALGGTTVAIPSIGTTTTANELSTTSIGVTAASNSAVTPIAGRPAWADRTTTLNPGTPIYALLTHAGAPVAGRALFFRLVYTLP